MFQQEKQEHTVKADEPCLGAKKSVVWLKGKA